MHKDTYKSVDNEKNGSVEELRVLNPLLFFTGRSQRVRRNFMRRGAVLVSPASDDGLVTVHDRKGPSVGESAPDLLRTHHSLLFDSIFVCSVFTAINAPCGQV